MLWLGLLTYSIGVFILECLLFIFGLHMTYETGMALALLNAVMGFLLGVIAYWKGRPAEIWGLYGTVAWPIALIHILSIPAGKERAAEERIDAKKPQKTEQEPERAPITVPVSLADILPVADMSAARDSGGAPIRIRLDMTTPPAAERTETELSTLQPTNM